MTFKKNAASAALRPRIEFVEIDALMVYLLRSYEHFMQAKTLLKEEHFSAPNEKGHRAIWGELVRLHSEFGTVPDRFVLETAVGATLDRVETERVAAAQLAHDVSCFFDYCYAVDMQLMPDAYGFRLLHHFLSERDVLESLRKHLSELGTQVPVSLPQMIRELTDRALQVEMVGAEVSGGLIPTHLPETDVLEATTTGIGYLDTALDGGWRKHEAVGLLGALGSGKSTLGIQATVNRARIELEQLSADPAYVPATSIFVTYEQEELQIQKKAIACAAKIPHKKVKLAQGWLNDLSTIQNPSSINDYERHFGGRGEYERYLIDAVPLDNNNLWRVIDFSGNNPKNPKAGAGYVEEICAALEKERKKGVKRFGLVVVDYALIACRRFIRTRGWDESKLLQKYVDSFGEDCRRLIAGPFDCTVLVLSQLSGEANTRSSTARVSHANAAAGRLFAENVTYCAELGTKDEQAGCVVMRWSKTRHSETPPEPTVLRYSAWSTLDEAGDMFIDDVSNKIVSRHMAERFGAGPATHRPNPALRHTAASLTTRGR